MRPDRERLRDILSAAEAALHSASPGVRRRAEESTVVTSLAFQLIVIGEAARAISEETRTSLPRLPWHEMTGMRNFIVHAYWSVDDQRVWSTVESDLPMLVERLREILDTETDA